MIARRTVVNLGAFLTITLALIAYGVVDLLGNPLSPTTSVSAVFPDASGIAPNFAVVLHGVVVGSVTSVRLARGGVVVAMRLEPGAEVPADVSARIGLANDLGEQQVELVPQATGGAPAGAAERSPGPIQSGARVPVIDGGVPTQVGQVIGTASKLLGSIGVSEVNRLLSELATGLAGRAGDLRTILAASQEFSAEFLAYQRQFEALLANAPPVLDGVAAVGRQLRHALASTEILAQVLDAHRSDLVRVLDSGASFSSVAEQLVSAELPNLACLIHDGAGLSGDLGQPRNLANLSVGLATNQWFFGAVEGISPTGPAPSLFPGDPYDPSQVWLRMRLLVPPAQPTADQYPTPRQLPPSLPGAGCNTEFGSGVGPATQAVAPLPIPGGSTTSPPPSSAARVRGGGGAVPSSTAGRPAGAGTSLGPATPTGSGSGSGSGRGSGSGSGSGRGHGHGRPGAAAPSASTTATQLTGGRLARVAARTPLSPAGSPSEALLVVLAALVLGAGASSLHARRRAREQTATQIAASQLLPADRKDLP